MRNLVFALLAIVILPGWARAYPDLIRHNYVNCTACHVSPTGGGLLNAYGRSMSSEVLSAWSHERESEVMHGALAEEALPQWFNIGGDVRAIQIHRETPDKITERFVLMQSTLETAVSFKRVTAVIAVGEADRASRSVRLISPRFYEMWNPVDELSVRAGRFIPVFGINVPYHTLPTRQSLGFAPGGERDAVESVWSGESWNLGLSLSRTPQGPVPADQRESLVTAQLNRNFAGSYRIGASFLKGATEGYEREAYGVHGLLGFSEKLAYLTEFTAQRTLPRAGNASTGLYHFSQLLYEVKKGWNVYLLEDYEKSDLENSKSLSHSLGPGVRFFPRPHFEFDAVFLKRRVATVADRYDDMAWILAHYYF